jgi:plastocyanin
MRKRIALPLAGLAGLAIAVVPALAADQTIEAQSGNSYSPSTVSVDPGDTVTISNPAGRGAHNVKWADRSSNEGPVLPGPWTETRDFGAGDAGKSFTFVCEAHGGMQARVNVTGGTGTTTGTTTQPTQTQTGTTGTTTSSSPPPGGGGTTTGTTTSTLPPPSNDDDAPSLSSVRGSATRRSLTVRLGVDEAGDIVVTVTRNGRRVVRRTFERSGSGAATLRIRRRFPRGRLVVRVQAVDAAGNRSPTRTLRLRVR